MIFATVKCTKSKKNEGNTTKEIQSAVWKINLPAALKLALPTPEELITDGNPSKYDCNLEDIDVARMALDGNPSDDSNPIVNRSTSIEVKGTDNSFASNSPIVILPSGSFEATYTYLITKSHADITSTITYETKVTYTYTFAAVENKLPLKPWTILSVVERILDMAQPIYSDGVNSTVAHPRYRVDPDQRDWLEYVDAEKKVLRLSPEFTMTRCTLREQLKIVGSYIHAEPRLIHKTVDGKDGYYIHFDPYGETIQSPAKGYPYVFRKKIQDINQYCTSINSMTDNMVNSAKWARGVVVNPWSGGGLSTRCASEHVRVTDTNGFAPTGFPVQRIARVLAGAWNRETGTWAVGMTDITAYVVESTAYNANLSSYGGVYPYSKSYAIYYTMGQKNLQGLFFREPTASQVSMKNWAIVNILASVSDWDAEDLQKTMEKRPFDFVFQIDYAPIYSSHIAHGKQDVDEDAVDYAQISNQSENLIEVSYYGENLKGIAARMGEVEEIRTGYLQKLSDLPKVGQMVDNMSISCVSYEMRPNGIKYTISLTKNFNRISQFIGINSHKRLYEVSERQAYERNVLLREYGVFKIGSKFMGKQGVFGSNSILDVKHAFEPSVGSMGKADHVFARLSSKDQSDSYRIVQLPVVASPMGNVASYSWRYADNYSAGSRTIPVSPAGEVNAYQTEVPYCDYYGRGWWYEFAVKQYNGENPNESTDAYPGIDRAMDLPSTRETWASAESGALFGTGNIGRLLLRKDSREALGFTAQLEFKSDTPGLIIGSGLPQRLPSISGVQTDTVKIYFLPEPINKFETRKLMDKNTISINISTERTHEWLSIKGTDKIPSAADGYQAWVIAAPPRKGEKLTYQDDDGNIFTDTNIEGGEVLLAMNTPIVGGDDFPTIYFTLVKDIFK